MCVCVCVCVCYRLASRIEVPTRLVQVTLVQFTMPIKTQSPYKQGTFSTGKCMSNKMIHLCVCVCVRICSSGQYASKDSINNHLPE